MEIILSPFCFNDLVLYRVLFLSKVMVVINLHFWHMIVFVFCREAFNDLW